MFLGCSPSTMHSFQPLYALDENPKRLVTLNVAGSIELRKGQNVSVYVKTTASSSWNVSIETGFSVVLIGADSLATPGILAGKANYTCMYLHAPDLQHTSQ